jgi:hypothetical protein
MPSQSRFHSFVWDVLVRRPPALSSETGRLSITRQRAKQAPRNDPKRVRVPGSLGALRSETALHLGTSTRRSRSDGSRCRRNKRETRRARSSGFLPVTRRSSSIRRGSTRLAGSPADSGSWRLRQASAQSSKGEALALRTPTRGPSARAGPGNQFIREPKLLARGTAADDGHPVHS